MSDQPNHIFPSEYEPPGEPELLRHAFTWRFADSGDREAVAHVVSLLYKRINELGEFGPRGAYTSTTVGELAAAAADLMATSADLARISRDPEFSEVDGRELQLCYSAKDWAAEVANIVERMTTLLQRPHQRPEPELPDPNGERITGE